MRILPILPILRIEATNPPNPPNAAILLIALRILRLGIATLESSIPNDPGHVRAPTFKRRVHYFGLIARDDASASSIEPASSTPGSTIMTI